MKNEYSDAVPNKKSHSSFTMGQEMVTNADEIWTALYSTSNIVIKWVPCHLGMARPQVADGGDAPRCGG
jgi:hypothetical protein